MKPDLSDRPYILLCHPETGSRLWVKVSPFAIDREREVVDDWVLNCVAKDYPGWGVPVDSETGKIIYNQRPPENERGPTFYERPLEDN